MATLQTQRQESIFADPLGLRGKHLANQNIIEITDALRVRAFDKLPEKHRSKMGQFGTPPQIGRFMASMFDFDCVSEIRMLDAGAGVGSLSVCFVEALCNQPSLPELIHITAFEVEPTFGEGLRTSLAQCGSLCKKKGIKFEFDIISEDFIQHTVLSESDLFFSGRQLRFNFAIQNPPYKKINSNSEHRKLLRRLGIETSNLYAAFVALTTRLLEPGGQLVAITPRSFCNGPYFKPFRKDFLDRMVLKRLHVFESRSDAFKGDSVLQENIILHATAGSVNPENVLVTSSQGELGEDETRREVSYQQIVPSDTTASFIHLITDGISELVASQMGHFKADLDELRIEISTGKVVDFRAKKHLKQEAQPEDFPLIYPGHLQKGEVVWPLENSKKPNGLARSAENENLLVPNGTYVLIKRFSSKEQRRRIEATLFDSEIVKPGYAVGFENHLNYIHSKQRGLERELAKGLTLYLNSSLVDMYFRLFSGHTQVNATDLRNFPFPSRDELVRLAYRANSVVLAQSEIDQLVREELLNMANNKRSKDPVASMEKVKEAQGILKELGFPRGQTNVRSALTLLSLLDLQPDSEWEDADSPMLGITEMMNYFAEHYGKEYAPNSRETVRRQTIHQFLDAGLVIQNPDDPSRPTNSGKNVYQISPAALDALRLFNTEEWEEAKKKYLSEVGTLKELYAQRRDMERIPVKISDEQELSLSPGGQNVLVKQILEEFLPRFAPGCELLCVGDTEDKWAYLNEDAFSVLGVEFDLHGKFPDVVAHYTQEDWLLLIEAVTSHGPVDPKRHRELSDLFQNSTAGLVFVTTFLTRKDMMTYMESIAWETEVWVAESPGHMIHFDGKRFLGPYDSEE